jgi:hypothetical protein
LRHLGVKEKVVAEPLTGEDIRAMREQAHMSPCNTDMHGRFVAPLVKGYSGINPSLDIVTDIDTIKT